jgi:hypothetical protein
LREIIEKITVKHSYKHTGKLAYRIVHAVAGTETEGPNSLGNQQEGAGNQGYSGAPGDFEGT